MAVLLGARQVGRNAERLDRMHKTLEIRREQLEATTRRPRDRDELVERMRAGRFRHPGMYSARKI